MSNNIKPNAKAIEVLLAEKTHIMQSIEALKENLFEINSAIKLLSGEAERLESGKSDKAKYVNWTEIVEATLRKNNRLMKTRDIVNSAFPDIDTNKDEKKRRIALLSAALMRMRGAGEIKAHEENGKRTVYGLAEWFDGDKPKPEYKPI